MELLKEQVRNTERLGLLVYSICIISLLIFYKAWVLSAVVGALTGLINFRIQVRGLNGLANGKSAFYVTANFYLRMLIIGAVLFMAFSKPAFNPYVVFVFMLSFQVFVIVSEFFKKK